MAEEKTEAKAAPLKTAKYTVKPGMEIVVLEAGERVTKKGGDEVKLTENQAVAFKDKIEDAPNDPLADPATIALDSQLLAGAATMQESNAMAGAAQVGEGAGGETSELSAKEEAAAAPAPSEGSAGAPALPPNVKPAEESGAKGAKTVTSTPGTTSAAPAADKK
jgi:hypothetical protein